MPKILDSCYHKTVMLVRDSSKFLKFDLGKLPAGRIVEVEITGSFANVRLVNSTNLYNYERSRKYEYTGGLVRESPYELQIPHNDRWYIIVDTQQLDGIKGDVKASVKIR